MSKTTASRRAGGTGAEPQSVEPFLIPYFAHQKLDEIVFPDDVGLPIRGRPHNATDDNGIWEDSDDTPEISSDEDNTPRNDKAKGKKRTGRGSEAGSVDNTNIKRMKVAGGRPAIAKKVTADLDSDDELLVRMKEAKYLEKDIAAHLAAEGRINYHPKTIGTRWARLRKVMQKRQDEMLDAELTDWHEGDDDILYQAVMKADEDVHKAKEAADARKWRIVADQMKALKPVINFSQNACRARFEALEEGTAKPTPESILDPDDTIKARIEARKEKEKKIFEDNQRLDTALVGNIQGNSWTSRKRTYF